MHIDINKKLKMQPLKNMEKEGGRSKRERDENTSWRERVGKSKGGEGGREEKGGETEAQRETERSGKQWGDVDLVRLVGSGRRCAAVDVGTPVVGERGARRPRQGVAGHRFLFAGTQWRSHRSQVYRRNFSRDSIQGICSLPLAIY